MMLPFGWLKSCQDLVTPINLIEPSLSDLFTFVVVALFFPLVSYFLHHPLPSLGTRIHSEKLLYIAATAAALQIPICPGQSEITSHE